jgi:ubiquinone/menaquinone biosynthesis C-methylase UbiE
MSESETRAYWERLGEQYRHASTMDENDRCGFKNAYIAWLRDCRMLGALADKPRGAVVVDLGCGEGSLTRALAAAGFHALGLDVAGSLLRLAREYHSNQENAPKYLRFDGQHLPLASASVDAFVVYEVLMYLDGEHLPAMLTEVRRVLRTDGVFIVVEQCRRKALHNEARHKTQRRSSEWLAALEAAGFAVVKPEIHRHGHFPLTYLIRMGWYPRRYWYIARALERWVGRWIGILPGDYADVAFVGRPA